MVNRIERHLLELYVLIPMVLLITQFHHSAFAQGDACSKPKVGVIMEISMEEEFIKYLNEQYPSQPKGSWLYEIQEKVLEELRMNSPGTQFIPATGGIPDGCDYAFRLRIALTGAGEDIEVGGLQLNEYTVYLIRSTLWENGSCGLNTKNVGKTIHTENEDVFKTIEQNIEAHGNIGDKIREHEESHRVPPRGPEMKVAQDREYVSPLEEERKLKIKIDVTNCKGEAVFDPHHGQKVTLPKKTERGELECTKGFLEGCLASKNLLDLIIQRPIGASATYTLKKGLKAEEVPIKILTCGIDRKDKKETKIRIHGLELKVKPEKKEIFPGEETKITATLSEVDVDGAKQPVAGKRIQVKVKGIANGHIHPSGDATTDQNGKAVLTYDAGDKDKKVIVKAKFQPKKFPDSVKDESTVVIAHYEGQVRMTYTAGGGCTEGSATVLVNFGKEDYSFLSGPDQMSIYCPVQSITILKAKAINNCPGDGGPPQIAQAFHPYHEVPLPPGEKVYLIFLKNTVSGKITDLLVNSCGPCIMLEYTCSNGSKGLLNPITTNDDFIVIGGDGISNASGGQGMIHWECHWRKSH